MLDIYTLTALSFFLFSIFLWGKNFNKKNVRYIFYICLLWLVFIDGFRWEIGTDWDTYKDFFDSGDGEYHMGIAYGLMDKLIHRFSNSYTTVTFTVAAIIYVVLGLFFIKKYSPQPFISLCVMYTGLVGVLGCNRQLIAAMCCILSLQFVFKRQIYKYLLLILLAAAFHITALLFIPAYFLYNIDYKNKNIILIVLLSFTVGISHVVNQLPFVDTLAIIDSMTNNTSLSDYFSDEKAYGTSIVGSFKRILFVIIALKVRSYVNNRIYDFSVLMYVVGCIIYLCFNGSMLQILAGRGCLYFNLFEIIWIPYMITCFPVRDRELKPIIWLLLFAFNLYIMQRDINSYFIISGVDIYHPYKSVLF